MENYSKINFMNHILLKVKFCFCLFLTFKNQVIIKSSHYKYMYFIVKSYDQYMYYKCTTNVQ